MNFSGVLFFWRRPSDDGSKGDQRWFIGNRLSRLDCLIERLNVFNVFASFFPVDGLSVPTVGLVASVQILGESDVGVIFNRNLV